MQSKSGPLNNLKCHISNSDSIPVEEFCTDSDLYEGELFLFCEHKHVLSFLKNPGRSIPQPSSTTQYYGTLPDAYPNFFKKCNDVMFEHFINIINLHQLEYWAGTAFAIRLFLESLIYANYGTYAWYGDTILRDKTDKEKVEAVNKRIGRLGFDVFMRIVISKEMKGDLTSGDSDLIEREYKLKDDRLLFAVEAAKKLVNITTNQPWIDADTLKKVQKAFGNLSPLVHARMYYDASVINDSLNDVLCAYEEFYSNDNEWRIVYER